MYSTRYLQPLAPRLYLARESGACEKLGSKIDLGHVALVHFTSAAIVVYAKHSYCIRLVIEYYDSVPRDRASLHLTYEMAISFV